MKDIRSFMGDTSIPPWIRSLVMVLLSIFVGVSIAVLLAVLFIVGFIIIVAFYALKGAF